MHPTPVQNNVRFSFSGPPPSVVMGPPPGMAVSSPVMASPPPGMTLISHQPPPPLMSINTQPSPSVSVSELVNELAQLPRSSAGFFLN